MTQKLSPNQLKLTRIYDAPIDAVWDAWTDLEQVAKWWGPRGFTITTHSKDLRNGGHWKYTMHGPDGTDYPNTTQYFEVIKNSLLVYDHGGNETDPPLFQVRAEFTALKDKTQFDMTMTFSTEQAAIEIQKFIKKAGGESTWDRLAEYLEKELHGEEKFVINRSFNTSIETLFNVWTDPDHLSRWLSPTGTEMKFIKADIRAGGSSFYLMFNNDFKFYGQIHYKELNRPDRIVYTQQFCDENGAISRHPMAPTWPETMLTTILFSSEGPDKTRVTITWEAYGPTTEEELQTFINARAGMTTGWTGSFDKLEDYLEKLSVTA